MHETDTINLLRVKTGSPKRTAIGKELRLVSVILTSLVISVGVLTTIASIVLTNNLKAHQRIKKQMEDAIVSETKKEGLFVSVQDRLRSIDTILSQSFPWERALVTILGLGTEDQIKLVTIDDTEQVSLQMNTATLEEAQAIIEKIISHIHNRVIAFPKLKTLKLDEEGKIQLSLSFQYKSKQ